MLAAQAVQRLRASSIFLLGTVLALPFVLALSLGNSLSHDEHQHIAAGVLFARDGLVPYRDFPCFHVPYLVYTYGLIFKFSDQYMLASRLVSGICAALTCGAVFATAWSVFRSRPTWMRLTIGVGAVAVLLSAPVFSETVGHSWNQEPSVLLLLLAFLCHHTALTRPRPGWLLLLGGVILGLGIGMHVTIAPVVLPFAVIIALGPSPKTIKLKRIIIFAAGIALALVPAGYAFLSAPEGFIFGNVEFPKLNIEYRLATGEPRTMTLPKKLRFFVKLVMRPNWILYYGFLAVWLTAWLRRSNPLRDWPRLSSSVLITLPFLLIGALAPSPAFDQYFYPLAAFLVLGILAFFAEVPIGATRLRWMWGTAGGLVLTAIALGAREYKHLNSLFRPNSWATSEMRLEAAALRKAVPIGRVLTLGPTLPLEAGLLIYPQFVGGPFAWRVAPFVSPDRRAALRVIAPKDLEAHLEADPPAALLLGYDDRWEEPLAKYAKAHGYRRSPFFDRELWLAPAFPAIGR